MGFVLVDSGSEVPARLADVHFATLARNSVHRGLHGGSCRSLRGEQAVQLQWGCVENSNTVLVAVMPLFRF